MKNIIILILLAITINTYSQFKIEPKIGIEYYPGGYETMTSIYNPYFSSLICEWGDFKGMMGSELSYSDFSIGFDIETFVFQKSFLKFKPIQALYMVYFKYKIKEFSVKLEHGCYHAVSNFGQKYPEMHGSYNKIGIYWNY